MENIEFYKFNNYYMHNINNGVENNIRLWQS
jgi:hypothetical protein